METHDRKIVLDGEVGSFYAVQLALSVVQKLDSEKRPIILRLEVVKKGRP